MQIRKSVPAFVIGLIAGILGCLVGIYQTACASLVEQAADYVGYQGAPSTVLIVVFCFFSAVCGLVGACLCFSKANIGGILMAIGAALEIAGFIIIDFEIIDTSVLNIVVTVLFVIAAILALVAKPSFKKPTAALGNFTRAKF